MDRQAQPFKPPQSGDILRESHMRAIADASNIANEYRHPPNSTYLRWAVTCNDADDAYPDVEDFPVVFPFRWVSFYSATGRLPIQDTTPVRTDFNNNEINASGIDGFVINRSPAIGVAAGDADELNENYAFNIDRYPVLGYLARGTLILVGYGQGFYYVASKDSTKGVILDATPTGAVSAATIAGSETSGFKNRTPVEFSCKILVAPPPTYILQASSVTIAAWSEWDSELAAGDLIKLAQSDDSRWKVIGAECG